MRTDKCQRLFCLSTYPSLLAAGAILGQVAQLALQDGLAALDEALQSLLLRESSHRREGRGGISYHFAHDKIREVVYAEAGDARRRVFQSRAYAAGVRGNSHRVAELALASVNQRIGNAYSLSNYNGQ